MMRALYRIPIPSPSQSKLTLFLQMSHHLDLFAQALKKRFQRVTKRLQGHIRCYKGS